MLFATYLTISNAAGSGLQIEQRTESAADLQTRSPQLLNRKLTYQLLHNRRPAPLRSQRIETDNRGQICAITTRKKKTACDRFGD